MIMKTQQHRTSNITTRPTAPPIKISSSLDFKSRLKIDFEASVVMMSVTVAIPHSGSLNDSTETGHVLSTWSSTALMDIEGFVDVQEEMCSVKLDAFSNNLARYVTASLEDS